MARENFSPQQQRIKFIFMLLRAGAKGYPPILKKAEKGIPWALLCAIIFARERGTPYIKFQFRRDTLDHPPILKFPIEGIPWAASHNVTWAVSHNIPWASSHNVTWADLVGQELRRCTKRATNEECF